MTVSLEWRPVEELTLAQHLHGGADAIRAYSRSYSATAQDYDDHSEVVCEVFALDASPAMAESAVAAGCRFAPVSKAALWSPYKYIVVPLAALERLSFRVQVLGGGGHLQTYSKDDSQYLAGIRYS